MGFLYLYTSKFTPMKSFLIGMVSAMQPTLGFAQLQQTNTSGDFRAHWYTAGAYLKKTYNEQTVPHRKQIQKKKN